MLLSQLVHVFNWSTHFPNHCTALLCGLWPMQVSKSTPMTFSRYLKENNPMQSSSKISGRNEGLLSTPTTTNVFCGFTDACQLLKLWPSNIPRLGPASFLPITIQGCCLSQPSHKGVRFSSSGNQGRQQWPEADWLVGWSYSNSLPAALCGCLPEWRWWNSEWHQSNTPTTMLTQPQPQLCLALPSFSKQQQWHCYEAFSPATPTSCNGGAHTDQYCCLCWLGKADGCFFWITKNGGSKNCNEHPYLCEGPEGLSDGVSALRAECPILNLWHP